MEEERKIDNITLLPDPNMTVDELLDRVENEDSNNEIVDKIDESPISNDESETVEENIEKDISDEDKKVLDEISNNPLGLRSEKEILEIMKNIRNFIGVLESKWNFHRKEFLLTEVIMQKLYDFNELNKLPLPEMEDKAKLAEWVEKNKFSGLDKLTMENIESIFGLDHPLSSVNAAVAVNTIKEIYTDFKAWIDMTIEYRQIHDSYMEYLEFREKENFDLLQKELDNESDETRRNKLEKEINNYNYRKYLSFLAEPLEKVQVDRLISTFSSEKKVEYLIEKGINKLTAMGISTKFILEISQFEKRFLPEKYHVQNNIFLLYFLQLLVYSSDVYNKEDEIRKRCICIVYGLDSLITKRWPEEVHNKIINNMIAFEDQFIGKLPTSRKEINIQ
jgi:hypothetical protein